MRRNITRLINIPSHRIVFKQCLLLGLGLLLVLSFPVYGQSGPPSFQGRERPFTEVNPPYPAPVTPMYTAAGGITNLGRYKGKLVLLNFWATWCAPCLYELPALDRLQKDMGGADFQVLTLNVDEGNRANVERYFKRLGIVNLPLLFDPAGRAPDAFKIHKGLPWTFVIDRNGLVRGYVMGLAEWDSKAARRLLGYYRK